MQEIPPTANSQQKHSPDRTGFTVKQKPNVLSQGLVLTATSKQDIFSSRQISLKILQGVIKQEEAAKVSCGRKIHLQLFTKLTNLFYCTLLC